MSGANTYYKNGQIITRTPQQQADWEASITPTFDQTKATKIAAINDHRDALIYTPIGPVDCRGDGTLMVEPDVRDANDRANLSDLHARALALKVALVAEPVIRFGAADDQEYALTPDEMMMVCQACFDRASLLFQRARQLKAVVTAATDQAGLDRVNATVGWIDGVGTWHSVS